MLEYKNINSRLPVVIGLYEVIVSFPPNECSRKHHYKEILQ